MKVVWFVVCTLVTDILLGVFVRRLQRTISEDEWDLAVFGIITPLSSGFAALSKTALRMLMTDPVMIVFVSVLATVLEFALRTTVKYRDKFYALLFCRTPEEPPTDDARTGLASSEMLTGAMEPLLSGPIGVLALVYREADPPDFTPVQFEPILLKVLSNYLSEGFGDMLVLLFGPKVSTKSSSSPYTDELTN